MIPYDIDTNVPTLGIPKIDSPMKYLNNDPRSRNFIPDTKRVLISVISDDFKEVLKSGSAPLSFEAAGPREKIFFDPSKLRCAMVTCGGLCPGINDIIRSIVFSLYFGYGVHNIYGIKYGLQGFIPKYGHDFIQLGPSTVVDILTQGGSILGSSRGPQDIEKIVDSLERMNIGILFMIGGDGTLRAALNIADAIIKRGLNISVVGIPKTIDNDIFLVSKSFGFDTAVEIATSAIRSAHTEAIAYPNGIGLIKLMGRYSGFIAVSAALAQQDVNFVLIPEADFDLKGENGLLKTLEKRLSDRKHAVIVAAEGAGQKFFCKGRKEYDASGNIKLYDIGGFLKDKIAEYFKEKNINIAMKYIDPSYMIRSVPANANDRGFCSFLGREAVHAGMAGKTKLIIGHWNNCFVHLPMEASVGKRKSVNTEGRLWRGVLEATGQGSLTSAV
ncbi:MAG: ATP-dependent 6-phosphofructokinase [Deltaproteobacteria bacterium]|nr:ATP-dependent 6-phosphofructokinase [Deltaproteobacteria bacterium]